MSFKINDVLKVNKTYKNSKFKRGTLVKVVDVGSQNEYAVTDGKEVWWYNAKDLTRRKSIVEDTVKIEKPVAGHRASGGSDCSGQLGGGDADVVVKSGDTIKLTNGKVEVLSQNNEWNVKTLGIHGVHQSSGIKHDSEKPDMSLLATSALVEMAKVMTFGKRKYSANNWRGGIAWTRVLAAAMRHLTAFNGGEDKDPETGISHLAHCACCLMFLLEFENTHKELDDRYKKENDGKR